jgi:hypothetical protein
MDLVTNEITFVGTALEAATLATRWGGHVLRTVEVPGAEPLSLLRVDPGLGDPGALEAHLQAINGGREGVQSSLLVSDLDAAALLSLAAKERSNGADVGVNPLGQLDSVLDGTTVEAETGPDGFGLGSSYDGDAFTWNHLRPQTDVNDTRSQRINVTEAWKLLERTGRLDASLPEIELTVHDDGYSSEMRDDVGTTGEDVDQPNDTGCGDGNPCRWHGTNVASAAAAEVDDSFGGAGPAGILGTRLDLWPRAWAGDFFDTAIDALHLGGPDVFNMSYSGEFPIVTDVLLLPFEGTLAAASDGGITFIAAAGNDGENVNAEDCFFGCWEESTIFPCESAGVICVGALGRNSRHSAGFSNWGGDVDIWAPGVLLVGPDPENPGNITKSFDGTSAAAPFVSGVVALMMAADSTLRNDEDALRAALYATATEGRGFAGRVVDAGAAVRRVLPPVINIDSPVDGRRFARGTSVPFGVFVWDAGEGSPAIEWVSDRDGRIGSGARFSRPDLSFGDHVVTATARFPDGTVASDTVRVTVTNDAPVLRILSPTDGARIFSGETVALQAESTDVNNLESGYALADSQVRWYLDGVDLSVTGHRATHTFDLAEGPHTLTVRGTDGSLFGEHSIQLVGAGATDDLPPTVQIIRPGQGDSFLANEFDDSRDQYYADVVFEGRATDPEDGEMGQADDLQWTIRRTDGPIEVTANRSTGIIARLYLAREANSTAYVVRFSATDSAGNTRWHEITVSVHTLH